jgi:ABC-type proline/glycine betaine transport system ATPase subunit
MDEPFGSLDTEGRKELQQELLHFQKRYPRTILLVTHDLAEAELLADQILVLDGGHVQQIGASQNVVSRPANLNVRHVFQEALTGQLA